MKVCITAAGLGSRMGEYDGINKALLPVEGKAAITHIIENFPGCEFVVALGHNSEQVRQYLTLAHPDVPMEFVEVPRYSGEGTGPLLSLYECRSLLRQPFFFVACDTIPEGKVDSNITNNTIYYDWVFDKKGYSFVHFDSDTNGLVVHGVQPDAPGWCSTHGYPAFSGMMGIMDFDIFWESAQEALNRGDAEIYHALNPMIDLRCAYAESLNWRDIGTRERYRRVIEQTTNFDFSKPDEFIYTVGDRVIKWFSNPSITKNRVARAALRPAVFPKIEQQLGGFYSYRFVPGKTLYEDNSVSKFEDFLGWMTTNVWEEVPENIVPAMKEFYGKKTTDRLAMFREKYPDWLEPKMVNGEAVLSIDELLNRVDMDALAEGSIPSFIHGDLQFDNIIHGPDGFCLLDWRQDFGGRLDLGDLYYDFAKLLGGIRLNYSFVKQDLFKYEEDEREVKIDVYQNMMTSSYEQILTDFIRLEGFSIAQTKMVLGIIYLNMAPLHEAPFDKFLIALAQRTLTQALS
jgi:choline kinase